MVVDAATETELGNDAGYLMKIQYNTRFLETLHEIQNSPGALTPFT